MNSFLIGENTDSAEGLRRQYEWRAYVGEITHITDPNQVGQRYQPSSSGHMLLKKQS